MRCHATTTLNGTEVEQGQEGDQTLNGTATDRQSDPSSIRVKAAKKTDILTKFPLDWDQFNGKPADECLRCIYKHARDASLDCCQWYWRSIRTKRRTSLTLRFLMFLLLIAGTVLPITAALHQDLQDRLILTQTAVALLASAGLLAVADRAFGWSSGWTRYITTVTAMEELTRKFELEWGKIMLEKSSAGGSLDVRMLFDLAQAHVLALLQHQNDETQKWVSEFNAGTALLETAVKARREAAEKTRDSIETALAAQRDVLKAEQKSRPTGAVELAFVFQGPPKPLQISLDSEPAEQFTGVSWARTGIAPGQHLVVIRQIDAPASGEIRKVINIQGAGLESVSVNVPAHS